MYQLFFEFPGVEETPIYSHILLPLLMPSMLQSVRAALVIIAQFDHCFLV